MTLLRNFWQHWKRLGKRVGDAQALFYYVVFAPFAFAVRWGSDPLAIKPGTSRGWCPKETEGRISLDRAGRQF
jgi:hypothetical protein